MSSSASSAFICTCGGLLPSTRRVTTGSTALPKPANPSIALPRSSSESSGRSAIAINTLAAAGFRNAYNILDGMEGSTVDDPDSVFHGMRLKNGWKASGLPWTYDLDPASMALPERETATLHTGNAED